MPPPAHRGDLGGEAGVDDETALAADRGPDEIIHRHRPVMRVAADEMIGTPGVALGVADRVELVFGKMAVHGAASAPSRGCQERIAEGAAAVQAWEAQQGARS